MSIKKRQPQTYVEEAFGILADDELVLDCVLVKPKNLKDEDLTAIRVWVPKFPLTKTSTITCARQEVQSYGANGTIAHLVFDLRSTGDSDGGVDDVDFEIDLSSIKAWSDERFGEEINFAFLGSPDLARGRVSMLPLRPGVIMETYYHAPKDNKSIGKVIYLSSYGQFNRLDEARCIGLAKQGYEVYGLDPMRYLLHASQYNNLTPDMLTEDIDIACQIIGEKPLIIGLPVSAGLALIWTALNQRINGVVAIGRAKPAFRAKHIFDLGNTQAFDLTQYIPRIAPRPLALVWHEGHALGGDKKEMALLYKSSFAPHRAERVKEVSPNFLAKMLKWQLQSM